MWNYHDERYLNLREEVKKAYTLYYNLNLELCNEINNFYEQLEPIECTKPYLVSHTGEEWSDPIYSKVDLEKIKNFNEYQADKIEKRKLYFKQYTELKKSMQEAFYAANPEAQYACEYLAELRDYCAFPPPEDCVNGLKSEKVVWIQTHILPIVMEKIDYENMQRALSNPLAL